MERSYPSGRNAHRLVAKQKLVEDVWVTLRSCGVDESSGVAFLCDPDDHVGEREEIFDSIGRTWGPKLVLGPEAPVVIADNVAGIPLGLPVFGFRSRVLEYLGALRRSPESS